MARLIHRETGSIVCDQVKIAKNFKDRAIGLMFTKKLENEALVIDPCNSIHTFFMNFPIDVAFINQQGKVIKIIKAIKPWRLTAIYLKASFVIEFPAHYIQSFVKVGDHLEIQHV